jgi:hypothetical protein
VDENDRIIGHRERIEAQPDGILPGLAARNGWEQALGVARLHVSDARPVKLLVVRMDHDRYMIHTGMGEKCLERSCQHRSPSQGPILLWQPFSRSGSASGGNDEGDDWHEGWLSVTQPS